MRPIVPGGSFWLGAAGGALFSLIFLVREGAVRRSGRSTYELNRDREPAGVGGESSRAREP